MISIITLGIAGIVFLLGVIVLQLGAGGFAPRFVFTIALLVSGIVFLGALTGVAGV
ncbi:MAG: hypothetical protein ROZ09_15090 [Thiobacillus sp.]|uniref:hypothetical protein n=1 Tax=Thiobacillus sp. TaxID=924 RepID=UPI002895E8FE|nr:hypothetical protein [Thiobacillus sp.]MDT3708146.1 hypothetical protein [Thiobacillus sp.]